MDINSRPLTRGDCLDGIRPCPWISCRYHLALEHPRVVQVIKRGDEWEAAEAVLDLPCTCALDMAREPSSDREMAAVYGITRQAMDQRINTALRRFTRLAGQFGREL